MRPNPTRPVDRVWRPAKRATLRAAAALLAAVLVAALAIASAWAGDVQEYEVKAAYLFNFARFAEWPAGKDDSPLQLCLIGHDDFGAPLAALEGKVVQNRPLHVKRTDSVDDLTGCHILFVGQSEARHVGIILVAVEASPMLTVSDIDGFAQNGGMVGLQVVDQRVQFDVNLGALRKSNIRLPAQVLKLARQVLNASKQP
jgi:hypothetical protein